MLHTGRNWPKPGKELAFATFEMSFTFLAFLLQTAEE